MSGASCAYRPYSTRSGDGKALFKFLSEHKQLCKLHFEVKYVSKMAKLRERLLPDAIPTIFTDIVPPVLTQKELISDAIRYGDCHKTTMEMADYWLVEKQLVHKLFKVLVPRYENYNIAYTRLLRAPRPCPGPEHEKAVLELRGNPYPLLLPDTSMNKNLIHNILLEEAKKSYRTKKYAEIAAKIDAAKPNLELEKSVEPTNNDNAQNKEN